MVRAEDGERPDLGVAMRSRVFRSSSDSRTNGCFRICGQDSRLLDAGSQEQEETVLCGRHTKAPFARGPKGTTETFSTYRLGTALDL